MRAACLVVIVAACASPKPAPAKPAPDPHATDAELDAACGKDAAACILLGARYWEADGVDVDYKRAYGAFERGCKLGSQEGCARAAMAIAQDFVPGDMALAYGWFDKACKAGEPRGCVGIAYMKSEGKGTAKDLAGATTVLVRECAAKNGPACGLLAVLYVNEQHDVEHGREAARHGCELDASFSCFVAAALAEDTQETYRLLGKACELGDGEACTTYGATLLAGHDIERDPAKAVKMLDRGCQLGAVKACRALGGALLSGYPEVATDDKKAAKALRKSCDGGDLSGCAVLGVAYATGRGVPQDHKRGIELMQRACDEGSNEATATGCYYLGLSYAKGEGIAQSYSEAAKYYERACDRSWGEACAALALLYEVGNGVTLDKVRATELDRRACEAGVASSCTKGKTP
jgi:TPR repeat protein